VGALAQDLGHRFDLASTLLVPTGTVQHHGPGQVLFQLTQGDLEVHCYGSGGTRGGLRGGQLEGAAAGKGRRLAHETEDQGR
jgi:hypothetical protein